MLSPLLIISILVLYFSVLIIIGKITSKNSNNDAFFIGERKSPWYIVAYGMIGATLSGITFLSVPGWVGESEFFYFQMVLGYVPGYLFVAYILMPVYYRLKLYSIYGYLGERFGFFSHKCGAAYFFMSRLLGASLRLYIVAFVLQSLLFDELGIPFSITTLLTIILIWLYTYKGGIKTIIWTDTLQTSFILLTLVACLFMLFNNLGFNSLSDSLSHSQLNFRIFSFSDFKNSSNFFRSFLSGMFIAIAMTGLDQDMMQKNLSCKDIKDAQKNMIWFSVILVLVNILFLYLGALLYQYVDANNLQTVGGDKLFIDVIQKGDLGILIFVLFLLGLISAAYSSADSALTSLTTCFYIDFLGLQDDHSLNGTYVRNVIHIMIAVLLFSVILLIHYFNNDSIIATLFLIASFTYGPLLGLFLFGLFTKRNIIDVLVPIIVVISPILSGLLYVYDIHIFKGFQFGPDLIIINGLITYIGLYLISTKSTI
jgi:SSS family solute:Na+ symporter